MVSQQQEFDAKYANRTLLLFACVALMILYVESMLTPALPSITKQFNITSAQASLILSMYLVSGTALNPIIGKLGDLYGKKRVLTIILPVYLVMVSITGFSPNYTFLVISRTIQGVGEGIFPFAFSIVREEFPREMIPRAQGLISAMFGIGAMVGIPVGAYISNNFGWQTTYHTAIPFVFILTVLVIVMVKESRFRRPEVKLDYVGATILAFSLAMVVLGLSEGQNWGWKSTRTVGMIAAGLILVVALAFFERRVKDPILDLGLLSQRNVLVSNLVILFSSLGLFLTFQSIVFELELPWPTGYGFDILSAGLYLVPTAAMMFVVSLPASLIISRVGAKPLMAVGSLIGISGFILLSTASSSIQLLYYSTIMASGLAMLFVSAQNVLILSVDRQVMGLATSMNTVFRSLGSSLGAPISGSLITTLTVWSFSGYYRGTPVFFSEASRTAFQYAFYIAAICFSVVLFISLFAKEVLGRRVNLKEI